MGIISFCCVNSQNNSSSWISIEATKESNSHINEEISLFSCILTVGFVGLNADFLNKCYVICLVDAQRADEKGVGGSRDPKISQNLGTWSHLETHLEKLNKSFLRFCLGNKDQLLFGIGCDGNGTNGS